MNIAKCSLDNGYSDLRNIRHIRLGTNSSPVILVNKRLWKELTTSACIRTRQWTFLSSFSIPCIYCWCGVFCRVGGWIALGAVIGWWRHCGVSLAGRVRHRRWVRRLRRLCRRTLGTVGIDQRLKFFRSYGKQILPTLVLQVWNSHQDLRWGNTRLRVFFGFEHLGVHSTYLILDRQTWS